MLLPRDIIQKNNLDRVHDFGLITIHASHSESMVVYGWIARIVMLVPGMMHGPDPEESPRFMSPTPRA